MEWNKGEIGLRLHELLNESVSLAMNGEGCCQLWPKISQYLNFKLISLAESQPLLQQEYMQYCLEKVVFPVTVFYLPGKQ